MISRPAVGNPARPSEVVAAVAGDSLNVANSQSNEIRFHIPPPPKGSFSLDPTFLVRFNVPHYPCWFYRLTQRVILGIYWRPYAE